MKIFNRKHFFVLLIVNWLSLNQIALAAPTIVSKDKLQNFCGGGKQFKWSYTPVIKKTGTNESLVINESFLKLKNKFCGVTGEMTHAGPYGSIYQMTVEFSDGSKQTIKGKTVKIDGKTVNKITLNARFAKRSWQLSWDSVALTGGVDILQLFIADHRHVMLAKEIMRGESFVVRLVTDAKFKPDPLLKISAASDAELSSKLTLDQSNSQPGKYVYQSSRLTLNSTAENGSFPSIGKNLVVNAYDKKISLPISRPAIDLKLVYADKGFGGERMQVDLLTRKEYFFVQMHVPRSLVVVKKMFGDTVKVKLNTRAKGASGSLVLKSKSNKYGRLIYQNEMKVSLAKGSYRPFINHMNPIAHNAYDDLDVTLDNNPAIKISVPIFWSDTQRSIAILKNRFEVIREVLSQGLSNKNISKKSKEVLHRKLLVIKNGLAILAHDRESANDETWNDWKKLGVGLAYNRLIQHQANSWKKLVPPTMNKRFSIVVHWQEEKAAIQAGINAGISKARNMLNAMYQIVIEGVYTVVVNVTGVNQMHTAIMAKDAFGNKVNMTGRILAGTEVVSAAILSGAHVLGSFKGKHGVNVSQGKGINAFYNKKGDIMLANKGMRAEHWMVEVYGTGARGGSQVKMNVGGKAGVSREYDAWNRVQKTAYDAKTGRVKFTGHNKTEFYADVDMLKRNTELKKVEWHFFVSEHAYRKLYRQNKHGSRLPTGSFGPVDNLLNALKKAQAELAPLGKEFKFVYHRDLIF